MSNFLSSTSIVCELSSCAVQGGHCCNADFWNFNYDYPCRFHLPRPFQNRHSFRSILRTLECSVEFENAITIFNPSVVELKRFLLKANEIYHWRFWISISSFVTKTTLSYFQLLSGQPCLLISSLVDFLSIWTSLNTIKFSHPQASVVVFNCLLSLKFHFAWHQMLSLYK